MANIPLPFIAPHDYDAFRRILHQELPGTYDEWLHLHEQEKSKARRVNDTIQEIPVDANEFVMFCRDSGKDANVQQLWYFAREKAEGQS